MMKLLVCHKIQTYPKSYPKSQLQVNHSNGGGESISVFNSVLTLLTTLLTTLGLMDVVVLYLWFGECFKLILMWMLYDASGSALRSASTSNLLGCCSV